MELRELSPYVYSTAIILNETHFTTKKCDDEIHINWIFDVDTFFFLLFFGEFFVESQTRVFESTDSEFVHGFQIQ